jgi:hypothetical protein
VDTKTWSLIVEAAVRLGLDASEIAGLARA